MDKLETTAAKCRCLTSSFCQRAAVQRYYLQNRYLPVARLHLRFILAGLAAAPVVVLEIAANGPIRALNRCLMRIVPIDTVGLNQAVAGRARTIRHWAEV